jgi:hypothetical protein
MQQATTRRARRSTGLVLRLFIVGTIGWIMGCADVDFNGPQFPDGNWPSHKDTTEQVRVPWEWVYPIPVGQHIEIKGVSGDIKATTASGTDVVVTATKIGQPDEVAAVSIAVVNHASGVTICAVYPNLIGRSPNECEPGDGGNMSVRDTAGGSAEVEFAVEVPEGVVFIGRTLAGDIRASGLRSDAFARTMAGDIRVSTTQLADATTQWGSVVATVGLADWGRELRFSTMVGDITLTIPAATHAVVHATTQSGAITSDFQLDQVLPGHAQGRVGDGGPTLTLSTLAGNIALKRGA